MFPLALPLPLVGVLLLALGERVVPLEGDLGRLLVLVDEAAALQLAAAPVRRRLLRDELLLGDVAVLEGRGEGGLG